MSGRTLVVIALLAGLDTPSAGSVERMIALSSALQGALPRNGRTTGA